MGTCRWQRGPPGTTAAAVRRHYEQPDSPASVQPVHGARQTAAHSRPAITRASVLIGRHIAIPVTNPYWLHRSIAQLCGRSCSAGYSRGMRFCFSRYSITSCFAWASIPHDDWQQVPWCDFHSRKSLKLMPDLRHGQYSEQFQAADASQLELGLTSGPMRRLERLGDPPEMVPEDRQVHRFGELPPVKQQ